MQLIRAVWSRWKAIAEKIGLFQSRLILTLFYFVLLLPIGLIFSLFKDELKIKEKRKSAWIEKIGQCETLEAMRKQS
jgi:hypothetical protein